jgi:hypothetical protein
VPLYGERIWIAESAVVVVGLDLAVAVRQKGPHVDVERDEPYPELWDETYAYFVKN